MEQLNEEINEDEKFDQSQNVNEVTDADADDSEKLFENEEDEDEVKTSDDYNATEAITMIESLTTQEEVEAFVDDEEDRVTVLNAVDEKTYDDEDVTEDASDVEENDVEEVEANPTPRRRRAYPGVSS